MNFIPIKSLAARVSLAAVTAGTLMVAAAAPAQAQQWGAAVQYGTPAYVVDRNVSSREFERRQFERERQRELRERREREEFLRRQARLRERREHRNHSYR
jgi:hypothetical protein